MVLNMNLQRIERLMFISILGLFPVPGGGELSQMTCTLLVVDHGPEPVNRQGPRRMPMDIIYYQMR